MSLHSWRALFSVVLLFSFSTAARGQSSTPTSQQLEPLWQTLLQLTGSLPSQIETFRASLLAQIAQLQTSNDNLQQTANSLQVSNQTLLKQNADLKNSLAASQMDLATSIQVQRRLQVSLDNSSQDIIKAQSDAKALERQVAILRIGCVSLGVVCGAVAVYESGRLVGVWK